MIYDEREAEQFDELNAGVSTVSEYVRFVPRITGFRVESWRCVMALPFDYIYTTDIGGHGRRLVGFGESASDAWIDLLGRMGAV